MIRMSALSAEHYRRPRSDCRLGLSGFQMRAEPYPEAFKLIEAQEIGNEHRQQGAVSGQGMASLAMIPAFHCTSHASSESIHLP